MPENQTTGRLTISDFGFFVLAAVMAWSAYDHWAAWHAEEKWREAWSVRGFIGCEEGHLHIRNIDFVSIPNAKDPILHIPTDDVCVSKEQTP